MAGFVAARAILCVSQGKLRSFPIELLQARKPSAKMGTSLP
jgi:hypothetical protein